MRPSHKRYFLKTHLSSWVRSLRGAAIILAMYDRSEEENCTDTSRSDRSGPFVFFGRTSRPSSFFSLEYEPISILQPRIFRSTASRSLIVRTFVEKRKIGKIVKTSEMIAHFYLILILVPNVKRGLKLFGIESTILTMTIRSFLCKRQDDLYYR